jgi:hypothetical protein
VSDGPEVALNWPFPDLNFFDSAQCLMVRRWRLIGHFPILYNPPRRPAAGKWTSPSSGWETTAESGVMGKWESAPPPHQPRRVKRSPPDAPPDWLELVARRGARRSSSQLVAARSSSSLARVSSGRRPPLPPCDPSVASTSQPGAEGRCRVHLRLSAGTAAGLLKKMPPARAAQLSPLSPLKSPLSPLAQVSVSPRFDAVELPFDSWWWGLSRLS